MNMRDRFEKSVKYYGIGMPLSWDGERYIDGDTWLAFLMYAAGERAGIERARTACLEQRCERGTPWDLAIMACDRATRALATSEEK